MEFLFLYCFWIYGEILFLVLVYRENLILLGVSAKVKDSDGVASKVVCF